MNSKLPLDGKEIVICNFNCPFEANKLWYSYLSCALKTNGRWALIIDGPI